MKKFILFSLLLLTTNLLNAAEAGKKSYRAVIDKDGVQRVVLVGGSYFFDPAHIIVKVNVPVELSVRKESGMLPHNIVVKAVNAGIDFDEEMGSEPKIIRFTPTKTGSYPMYCSKKFLFFESHREKGMEGVLEVEE
ncbi:MAG TPA: quinol oxidase [Geobacteraceae bacterium]|nr:quinol oxidase [Geobacteraceae bacterium]